MIRIGRTAQGTAQEAPTSTIKEGNRRVLAVKATLLMFFVLVAFRLVQIQVIDSGTYRERARRQYEKPQEIPAQRGTIFDRSGHPLVTNARFISFGADPAMVGERSGDVAERFAAVFNRPRGFYVEKFSGA
jgi:cell division protein FtsI/penicillin-binding protein 2